MGVIAAIVTVAFGILLPFEDSRLQGTPLRFGGASLALLPLLALCVISVLRGLAGGRLRGRTVVYGAAGICYAVAVTVVYLDVFDPAYGGLFLLFKAAKYGFLLAVWLAAIPVLADQDPRALCWAARLGFAVALLGVLVCDVYHSQYWQLVAHFHLNLNMRPRGFSLESSTLGVQVGCLGLLTAATLRRALAGWIPVALALGVAVYSATKGGQVALILALVGAALMSPGASGWRSVARKLVLLAIPAAAAVALAGLLSSVFARSVHQSTSVSTRLTGAVVGLVTVLHNPFGMGLGGMIPAFDKYAFTAMDVVRRLPIQTHFAEVRAYAASTTGRDLSTKSFLFDQLIVLGVPFLYFFVRLVVGLVRRLRASRSSLFLIAAVLFAVIAICTYDPALGFYNAPFVFGFALAVLHSRRAPRRPGISVPAPPWRPGGRLGAPAHAAAARPDG